MVTQICESCKHKSGRCYCSPNSTCSQYEEEIKIKTEYEKGYARALEDINRPMCVVAEKWNPSECPRCEHDFSDYEECNDRYYDRAKLLERCPYCGQRLDWDVVDL